MFKVESGGLVAEFECEEEALRYCESILLERAQQSIAFARMQLASRDNVEISQSNRSTIFIDRTGYFRAQLKKNR